MNSMQRLAVICMLALGLLSAGMAQSQGQLARGGKNPVVATLNKGLVYVGLPLMLCLGSCDNAKHAPDSQPEMVAVNEAKPEMVTANGYWVMREDANKYGVYDGLPDWVGNYPSHYDDYDIGFFKSFIYRVPRIKVSDDVRRRYDEDSYKFVKLHDETGKIIPEALRESMEIMYEEEGLKYTATISDISDTGVLTLTALIGGRFGEIDASQVVGVRIIDDLYQYQLVLYPIPLLDIPYLQAAITDSQTEINTTDDIYLSAKIVIRYTSGDAIVRLQKDRYYIRHSSGDEHVFIEHKENIDEIPYGLLTIERENFIMEYLATIVDDGKL